MTSEPGGGEDQQLQMTCLLLGQLAAEPVDDSLAAGGADCLQSVSSPRVATGAVLQQTVGGPLLGVAHVEEGGEEDPEPGVSVHGGADFLEGGRLASYCGVVEGVHVVAGLAS